MSDNDQTTSTHEVEETFLEGVARILKEGDEFDVYEIIQNNDSKKLSEIPDDMFLQLVRAAFAEDPYGSGEEYIKVFQRLSGEDLEWALKRAAEMAPEDFVVLFNNADSIPYRDRLLTAHLAGQLDRDQLSTLLGEAGKAMTPDQRLVIADEIAGI